MRPLPTVGLIEMGYLGEIAVRVVAANLQTILDLPVEILEPAVIPRESFQPQRQQYDAGLIVKYLARLPLASHPRILGLTVFDLCLPILTYVYGEAEVGGRAAVISNFRLRQNEDGSTAPPEIYFERLAKVAVHEMAHTLALHHCENAKYLMHFAARLKHLDQIPLLFCDHCEFALRMNRKEILHDFHGLPETR
jgi:archaemetzincin